MKRKLSTNQEQSVKQDTQSARRRLLKTIAAGSGAVIAGKNLPDNWTKPAIDSVLLPAHAQTSPAVPPGSGSQDFPASGTFTVPAGVTSITVDATGGAGGGGGGAAGGGGTAIGLQGFAGVVISTPVTVTPGATLTITVGGGGAGGEGGDAAAPAAIGGLGGAPDGNNGGNAPDNTVGAGGGSGGSSSVTGGSVTPAAGGGAGGDGGPNSGGGGAGGVGDTTSQTGGAAGAVAGGAGGDGIDGQVTITW